MMFEKEAEAYATSHENTKYTTLEWWSKRNAFQQGAEFGYRLGLEAGRMKWHKVADGDLPKEEAEYLVIFESDGTKYRGLECYYPNTKEWSTVCKIIVWLGIPEYTKE